MDAEQEDNKFGYIDKYKNIKDTSDDDIAADMDSKDGEYVDSNGDSSENEPTSSKFSPVINT